MIGGWLKRFRGDKTDRQRMPVVDDWRQIENPKLDKPKSEWLDKLRDDAADLQRKPAVADLRQSKKPIAGKPEIGWLDQFHDDEQEPKAAAKRKPRPEPEPEPEPAVAPASSRNINLFEWLMYISLAVEVVATASDFGKLAKLAGGWPVVVLTEFFTIAFFGIFIFVAVYLRKKWALYVLAAFYGFRLLRYIPSFAYIALPLVQFLSAVQFILQGLALFYAFSEEARPHFAKAKR
ncbi:MAG TPA: hypothetical protein VKT73_06485 [Xanthobacteraceae bacterium]|nr:hypothetical protein [Xanthobacteraceae bacterium]